MPGGSLHTLFDIFPKEYLADNSQGLEQFLEGDHLPRYLLFMAEIRVLIYSSEWLFVQL